MPGLPGLLAWNLTQGEHTTLLCEHPQRLRKPGSAILIQNSEIFSSSLQTTVPVSFVDNASETKRLQVREGFKLALNCSATGNPAPAYGWDKVDSNTPILFNNRWLGNRHNCEAF